ncbi:MAG: beta-lactamase family protein [Thermomicrobiales bacterium]|nr:beta-lactamase family protein [Thermomicrobiales bacterium]
MATNASHKLQQTFDLIDDFVARGEVAAAAVAIAWHGEQIGEHHAGMARPDVPASASTLWPLASISKVYSAAAVMALVERGVLTLSMPIRLILPEFTGDGRDTITLRHLLTHTSGMIYESPEMEQRLLHETPLDELVDEVYHLPLQFTPGTQHAYSDYNYAMAGRVAEVATGQPFPDLVRDLVLTPGGLHDTHFPSPPDVTDRLALVAGPLGEGTSGDMYNSAYGLGLAHPAFGVSATVADLLRFGLLFAPGGSTRVLSEAGVQVMSTDQTGGNTPGSFSPDLPARDIAWGAGFAVKGDSATSGDLLSPTSFGHGGATGCTLQIDPEEDIVIAYVSNKHARTGRPPFTRRQVSVVNTVLAALTRRSTN